MKDFQSLLIIKRYLFDLEYKKNLHFVFSFLVWPFLSYLDSSWLDASIRYLNRGFDLSLSDSKIFIHILLYVD